MSKDIQKIKSLQTQLTAVTKGTMLAPKEVIAKIETLAPEAVETLEQLMRTSKADSVRLKAALEILGLAGISKETRVTLTTRTEDMDDESLNARLNELLGDAATTVLEGEYKEVNEEKVH